MAKKNPDVEASKPGGQKPVDEMEASTHSGAAFTGEFDVSAWVRGVKPIRRSVTLYQRLDLLGERDLLGEELQDARLTGATERAEALEERIRELTDEILASSMRVVIEGVTSTRFKEILDEAKHDRKLKDADDVALYQIAQQIVEPSGFTYEVLRELDDLVPTQTAKIGTAWAQINNSVPAIEASIPL